MIWWSYAGSIELANGMIIGLVLDSKTWEIFIYIYIYIYIYICFHIYVHMFGPHGFGLKWYG